LITHLDGEMHEQLDPDGDDFGGELDDDE